MAPFEQVKVQFGDEQRIEGHFEAKEHFIWHSFPDLQFILSQVLAWSQVMLHLWSAIHCRLSHEDPLSQICRKINRHGHLKTYDFTSHIIVSATQ